MGISEVTVIARNIFYTVINITIDIIFGSEWISKRREAAIARADGVCLAFLVSRRGFSDDMGGVPA
jgi:hypothetical protein